MKSNSGKVIQFLLGLAVVSFFLVVGLVLLCAQFSFSTWCLEHDQAVELEKKDFDEANAMYKKAVSDAAGANNPDKNPELLYKHYGNFLWNNSHYMEAYKIYQLGLAFADKYKLPSWQGSFLERLGTCQHYMFLCGDLDSPDPSLIEKAVKSARQTTAIWTTFMQSAIIRSAEFILTGMNLKNLKCSLIRLSKPLSS